MTKLKIKVVTSGGQAVTCRSCVHLGVALIPNAFYCHKLQSLIKIPMREFACRGWESALRTKKAR